MEDKKRLDKRLHDVYPHISRERARRFIISGRVRVNGTCVTRPAKYVTSHDQIVLVGEEEEYVCCAGHKLAFALAEFDCSLAGDVVLDVGVATGGFTECALRSGARHVYGVDVGHGQIHPTIANDARTTIYEGTHIADYVHTGDPITCVVIDVSFISVVKVFDAVMRVAPRANRWFVLVKPQFEVGRASVTRSGIVRDERARKAAIDRITDAMMEHGWSVHSVVLVPQSKERANREYMVCATR